jgi:hypothetical protein
MRILSFKAIIFCSALFFTPHSFAMQETIYTQQAKELIIYNDTIKTYIHNQLDHENQNNFRLVCKEWAHKDKDWNFIPNDVAKETDHYIQKYHALSSLHKTFISMQFIYNNNIDAIKWILKTTKCLKLNLFIKCLGGDAHTISSQMFAKSNNHKEIAHLLITHHKLSEDKNWENYYEKLMPNPSLQKCLETTDRFAYLHYLMASITNDNEKLKNLFTTTRPTKGGIEILLALCCYLDSINCFNFLLEDKEAQELITTQNIFTQHARENKSFAILTVIEQIKKTDEPRIIQQ